MFRIFRPQSGFSIVQGMIIASVLAGSALLGTRLITDQKLAQKGSETRDQIEQIHQLIYSTLQNQDHCAATMNSALNTGALTFSGTRALNAIVLNSGGTLFQTNTGATYDASRIYMNGNVTIQSMELVYPGTSWTALQNLSLPTSLARLKITYRRLDSSANLRTKKGYGAKTISKTISLAYQFNPASAGQFNACYAVTTAGTLSASELGNQTLTREFCEGFFFANSTTERLFTWDAVNNICRLKTFNCPAGQIFTGIDSTGVVKCRRIEQWLDVKDLVDWNQSVQCAGANPQRMQITTDGKKARIGCPPMGQ